ncbi:MAG: nicotinate-nucleotide adenylyltransferase [Candidatus Rifleibacteriota bacterium]
MKTGLFGGSFNPIHQQHLQIARAAKENFKLDSVWFVPVYNPVHKSSVELVSYDIRRELLKTALKKEPDLTICDVEKEMGGLSYTVRTIKYLKSRFPEEEFFLIIGGDSLSELDSWRNVEELVNLTEFIVVERPGFHREAPVENAKIHWLETSKSEISSTDLRKRLKAGRVAEFDELIPEVYFKILRNNYYSAAGVYYSNLINEIDERLINLPIGLKEHIEAVAYDCFIYARNLNQPLLPAIIAGLSHDLFRASSDQEILDEAFDSGFELLEIEKELPMLAHGVAAAGFLKRIDKGIDPGILQAVRYHTKPKPGLDNLGKILVLADTLESSRNLKEREELRQANISFEEKFLQVLEIKKKQRHQKVCKAK